jgi:hypothetical protein
MECSILEWQFYLITYGEVFMNTNLINEEVVETNIESLVIEEVSECIKAPLQMDQ